MNLFSGRIEDGASPVELKAKTPFGLRHVIAGALAGGGIVGCVELLITSQPKAIVDMLSSFGPLFVIAAGMVYVLDRRMGQFISTSKEFSGELVGAMTSNATAQQKLADAVSSIASRDDQRARETELVLSHLARTSEEILKKVNSLEAARA